MHREFRDCPEGSPRQVSLEEQRNASGIGVNKLAEKMLLAYRKAAGNKYDFDHDPAGLLCWDFIGRVAEEESPLTIDGEWAGSKAE